MFLYLTKDFPISRASTSLSWKQGTEKLLEFAQTAVRGEKAVEIDDTRSKSVEERIENALVKV